MSEDSYDTTSDSMSRSRASSVASQPETTSLYFPPPPSRPIYHDPALVRAYPHGRKPLPTPPVRPPLPPATTALVSSRPTVTPNNKGKGKQKEGLLDPEKLAYARTLGLEDLSEESEGVVSPISPLEPPQYQRRGTSTSVELVEKERVAVGGEGTAPEDEKAANEIANIVREREEEAARVIDEDLAIEKARVTRVEQDRTEEEQLWLRAVEQAESSNGSLKGKSVEGPPTPPPPPASGPSSSTTASARVIPPTRNDLYPIDSKQRPVPSVDSQASSSQDSLFNPRGEDVPTYEPGPAPPNMLPIDEKQRTAAPPAPQQQLPPVHPRSAPAPVRRAPSSDRLRSSPPPPSHHQRYQTEPQPSYYEQEPYQEPQVQYRPPSPAYASRNLLPPPPAAYQSSLPTPNFEQARPSPLTRHASLQPSNAAAFYAGRGTVASYPLAPPPQPGEAGSRPQLTRASLGPGGSSGFYGSGIGLAMREDVPAIPEDQSPTSQPPVTPTDFSPTVDRPLDVDEVSSNHSHGSRGSRVSGTWNSLSPALPAPSTFQPSVPFSPYRPSLPPRTSSLPSVTLPAGVVPVVPIASPTGLAPNQPAYATHPGLPPPPPPQHPQFRPPNAYPQLPPGVVPAVPIAYREPQGYYSLGPGTAPIPFYSASPYSSVSTESSSSATSYFPAPVQAPAGSVATFAAPQPQPQPASALPSPPAPHSGYSSFIPASTPPVTPAPYATYSSPPPELRPLSSASSGNGGNGAAGGVTGAVRAGTLRGLWSRKGKKERSGVGAEGVVEE